MLLINSQTLLKNHSLKFIIVQFILISLLSACGGGGGTSTSENNTSSNTVTASSSSIDDHHNSIERATNISLNSSNRGNIENPSDIDFFGIQTPGLGTLNIYSIGSTDTVGSLYDFNGNKLSENDNGGGNYGNNFNMRGPVNGSWYYISVRHRSSTGTGSYMIRADFTPSAISTANNSQYQSSAFDCKKQKENLAEQERTLQSWGGNGGAVATAGLTASINHLKEQIALYCR